ncbi:MAG: helix-turn-helix transcriptional regulator [bacterium]
MSLNIQVGNRITQLRQEQKLTLEKLAYESGISKGGLSEIERGLKEPRLSTLVKLCETLDISLKYFFDFDLK